MKCEVPADKQVPPFKITFPVETEIPKRYNHEEEEEEGTEKKDVVVEPYVIPNRGNVIHV